MQTARLREDLERELEGLATLCRDEPSRALARLDAIERELSPADPMLAQVLALRALALIAGDDIAEAARAVVRAELVASEVASPRARARARVALANVMITLGQPEVAHRTLRRARVEVGDDVEADRYVRQSLASVARRMGRTQEAAVLYDALAAELEAFSDDAGTVVLINAASAWWQVGRVDDAERALGAAEARLRDAPSVVFAGWIQAIRAWIAGAQGEPERAAALTEEVLRMAPAVLDLCSSAIRASLHRPPPSADIADRIREAARALVTRCRAAGRLSEVAELSRALAADARERGDAAAEAEHLRVQCEVEAALAEQTRNLLLAGDQARAAVLAWQLESDAIRSQAAALAEANARLEALAFSRARLLRAVAHDLRSPLTALSLGLDALEGQDREVVDSLRRATDHLTRIVDAALSEGRILHGEPARLRTRTDLAALIHDVLAAHALPARQRGVTIVPEVPEGLAGVVDPAAVRRILHNLVSNAVKFTAVGSRVMVRCTSGSGRVRVDVEDEGPGFGTDDTAHLLLDGVRGAAGFAGDGHGIGLHTVYRLATAIGGTLTLEDRAEGGARATVRLPVEPA